jgi:hypothetical protein
MRGKGGALLPIFRTGEKAGEGAGAEVDEEPVEPGSNGDGVTVCGDRVVQLQVVCL